MVVGTAGRNWLIIPNGRIVGSPRQWRKLRRSAQGQRSPPATVAPFSVLTGAVRNTGEVRPLPPRHTLAIFIIAGFDILIVTLVCAFSSYTP